MRLKIMLAVIMLGLVLGAPSGGLAFTFTTIDPPGAIYTNATGINAAGQIVGVSCDVATGCHGFLKDGATFTTIDVPGASFTQPWGINAAGQVVGYFNDGTGTHGFLKDGATFTTIDVPGATSTFAFGINDAGQIVGFSKDAARNEHGFLKDGATFTTIDVPGAYFPSTEALGINNAGQIVGVFCEFFGCPGFLKDGATFTTIQAPGASFYTVAFGINDAGQIVGYFNGPTTGEHAFLKNGTTFTTIEVPGALFTGPSGINNVGQIVGFFFGTDGTYHGFVTTPLTVPFAAFAAKVEIENGAFEVKANFTLGAASDGIDPLIEDASLQVGTFSTTIPAGSFKFHPAQPGKGKGKGAPARWTFEGVIDGVTLDAKITDLGSGSFEFKAEGEGADLTGAMNPITVKLTIGDDGGSATVQAEFE